MAQTYQNWECIVVDDGSTDRTKTVVQGYVKKDTRFILVDRPETHQPGGNGARNYGFEISKGDYIQWFDSDDLMQPDFLSEKINSLKRIRIIKVWLADLHLFPTRKYWKSN